MHLWSVANCSHPLWVGLLLLPPKADWNWATDQRCIQNDNLLRNPYFSIGVAKWFRAVDFGTRYFQFMLNLFRWGSGFMIQSPDKGELLYLSSHFLIDLSCLPYFSNSCLKDSILVLRFILFKLLRHQIVFRVVLYLKVRFHDLSNR